MTWESLDLHSESLICGHLDIFQSHSKVGYCFTEIFFPSFLDFCLSSSVLRSALVFFSLVFQHWWLWLALCEERCYARSAQISCQVQCSAIYNPMQVFVSEQVASILSCSGVQEKSTGTCPFHLLKLWFTALGVFCQKNPGSS